MEAGEVRTARRVPPGAAGPAAARRRRFDRMAAFLKLAGDATTSRLLDEFRQALEQTGRGKPSSGSDLAWDMSDPGSVWASMARLRRKLAYGAFDQLLRSERAAMRWTGPAGWPRPMSPGSATGRPARPGAAGSGPPGHLDLAGRPLPAREPRPARADGPRRRAGAAARECPAEDRQRRRTSRCGSTGPASTTRLSPRQRTDDRDPPLALTGGDVPQKV